MNEPVPRGYFSPEEAIEYFGRRLKFAGWDTTKLSEIGREALKHELEKTEKASSKQEIQHLLRHLLFEEILSAKHFIGGKLLSFESSIWLNVEAEYIIASGWATTRGGHEYFPAEVRGRVLIEQSSIDALFDGDTDDPETGAEDPPAQTQPPHVELNLPDDESTPDDTREQAEEPPEPKKRGAKPKYLWNDFWREVVRIANTPDGLPQKQADLEKRMLNWCQRSWGDEPGLSTVREMLNKLEPYLGE